MSITVAIIAAFGAFSIIGGIIGFVKARSTASLVAGTLSGALLLLCAYGIKQGSPMGGRGSLIISLALGWRFLKTWQKNRRVMPDLIMIILSAAAAAASVATLWPR